MRPLKPSERREILERKSGMESASVDAAIDEYEKLMSEHFKIDPNLSITAELKNVLKVRETRIEELYRFLFQDGDSSTNALEK